MLRVRAHSGRALAQGFAAFARAGASSFVSKSVLTVARPQAASRLLSTTSTIKQHPKEENQAPPTHTSPPPLLSQESNAPAPANGGLALPLDGIRILDLTRVLGKPWGPSASGYFLFFPSSIVCLLFLPTNRSLNNYSYSSPRPSTAHSWAILYTDPW
jgi:hypothetical protein